MAALAVAVAACGDDSSGTTAATTTAAGATSASTGTGGCKLDRSPRFVGLAEVRGESSAAIDDFNQGWQMAIDELNAGGGVCGKPVEYTRIPTSPTDTNQAKNAFLQGLDKKPDYVSGPISSSAVVAIAKDVNNAGIPVLYMSTSTQALVGGEVGTKWAFTQRPRNDAIANAVSDHVVKTVGAKKIGLLCVDVTYGTTGCDAAAAQIKKDGAQVAAREVNSSTAQDLTSQVIALRSAGVDAVITFNFPNPVGVFMNQAADNGLNVPVFAFTSASIAVGSKTVKANALGNLWGTDDCAPVVDANATKFRDTYTQKYNKALPGTGYTVAEAYDAFMIGAEAIRKAGSLDPAKVAEAMRTNTFNGVCAKYKADSGQDMHQSSVIIRFGADGTPKLEKTLDLTAA